MYSLGNNGYILNAGKFYQEHISTVHAYEACMDGHFGELEFSDGTGYSVSVFVLDSQTRRDWAIADNSAYAIGIEEDEQGFVYGFRLTKAEFQDMEQRIDALHEEQYVIEDSIGYY